ncbi:hypothetical protein QQP08_013980 [Theobroma cacao]|nr:hypothetical protein QQP08_013980 [Theobroma cacao]
MHFTLVKEKRLGGKDGKFEVKHLLLMSTLIDVRCGYQLIIDSLGRESISCSYSASFSSDSQFARNSNFFPFILFLLSLYIPESEKPKHCGFRVMELALVHHLDPPQLATITKRFAKTGVSEKRRRGYQNNSKFMEQYEASVFFISVQFTNFRYIKKNGNPTSRTWLCQVE